MVAKVDICNMVGVELRAEEVNTLSDSNSVLAKKFNIVYDATRREILEMHPWNFATKRAELPQLVVTPLFGYSYAFQMPADFIKNIVTENQLLGYEFTNSVYNFNYFYPEEGYKIENGKKLYSNNSSEKIIYVANIEDTTQFSSLFTRLLILKIAQKIALAVTGAEVELTKQIEIAKAEAKTSNAQQKMVKTLPLRSSFIDARRR